MPIQRPFAPLRVTFHKTAHDYLNTTIGAKPNFDVKYTIIPRKVH